VIASLEIDFDAIRRNVEVLRALVAPAGVWPVLKANAYGHGLREVGAALEHTADGLCVYAPEEGLALREAGVRLPILVMGPTEPRYLEEVHAADLILTLWDTANYRKDVTRIARKRGQPQPLHVKIETGVARFGFDAPHAAAAIADLLGDTDLRVEGVFTHLAAVEEFKLDFTLEQLRRFEDALAPVADTLRERGSRRHTAASAATMIVPRSRFDLVRPGIATYGLWPSPQTRAASPHPPHLLPALSWRSTLVAMRDVQAGQSIGYGRTYHAMRPSRIGVVPIGYAEGVPRAASNVGAVLIAGKRAPIVGRVCMNATLVDVTDIPAARPGARVTLIGRCGEETLGADDWASWTGTINYEIVARLPAQIPKVFLNVL
jgi:alanine racemase